MLFVSPRVLKREALLFDTIVHYDRNPAAVAGIRSLSGLHAVCHKTGAHERNIVEADRHSSSKRESIIKYHTVLFHVPKNCICVMYDAVIYVHIYTGLTHIT